MVATIQFNKAASELLQGRTGGKLRMSIDDGVMRCRPTDRKAGPHVLTEYQQGSRGGIAVQIDDKQLEKLGAGLEHGSQFTVEKDKYGWFALRPTDGENVDGASAKVSMKAAGKSDSDSE